MPISRFLLDYLRFRREVQPLEEKADNGEYDAVRMAAEEIIQQLRSEKWILENRGTTLTSGLVPKGLDQNHPTVTGFAFLIIFSQYLKPIPFKIKGMGYIEQATRVLGWNEREISMFTVGQSHTTLLKPELAPDPLERPTPDPNDSRWNDPAYYWWRIRPLRAFRIGWWDLDLIDSLRTSLAKMKTDFEQLDITKLELPHEITSKVLLDAYNDALKLYDTALAERVGLYLILS